MSNTEIRAEDVKENLGPVTVADARTAGTRVRSRNSDVEAEVCGCGRHLAEERDYVWLRAAITGNEFSFPLAEFLTPGRFYVIERPRSDEAEAYDYARARISIATPGEWYVWADEDEGTVQLLSRTHGAITPRLPDGPQTRGNLMAAAAAVNLVRLGSRP